jgi:hypothetical protein
MISLINHDSSEGEQWGRYNLPIYYTCVYIYIHTYIYVYIYTYMYVLNWIFRILKWRYCTIRLAIFWGDTVAGSGFVTSKLLWRPRCVGNPGSVARVGNPRSACDSAESIDMFIGCLKIPWWCYGDLICECYFQLYWHVCLSFHYGLI